MNRRYVLFLILLTAITFGGLLRFTFWKDDWFLLWSSTYQMTALHKYWSHPATVIEFVWFTKLFGLQPLGWQFTGLALHAATAVALAAFAGALMSSAAGVIAGILYAVSVGGMDAVGWPAAHVVLWSSIFLLIGLTYIIRYLRHGAAVQMALALLYLGIGIFLDPFRNFPVAVMVPLLFLAVPIQNERKLVFKKLITAGIFAGLMISVTIFIFFRKEIIGSQLFSHILANPTPMFLLKKMYVTGNYFNSLANLMLGWAIRFPEDGSTGTYMWFVARVGFIIFCATVGIAYKYLQSPMRKIGIILFSLLWIFLFYVPNWLFEPRLTMGITHRYMALSGLGFILAVAYIFSLIKRRPVRVICIFVFVVLNILSAWHYTGIASLYRSAKLVDKLWETIDAEVPKGKKDLIFMFGGDRAVSTYVLSLSGSAPFGLRRQIGDVADLPIVTDADAAVVLICRTDPVPLNHVYSWSAGSGKLTNESLAVRRMLLAKSLEKDCVPAID